MAVMDVGGGVMEAPAAIRSLICSVYMPPSVPMIARSPRMAKAMRFFMVITSSLIIRNGGNFFLEHHSVLVIEKVEIFVMEGF